MGARGAPSFDSVVSASNAFSFSARSCSIRASAIATDLAAPVSYLLSLIECVGEDGGTSDVLGNLISTDRLMQFSTPHAPRTRRPLASK